MQTDKLKLGNALQENIQRVKGILKQWQETNSLANKQIQLVVPPNNRYEWVPVSDETFTIVRAINIAFFTDMLAKLEKEFEEL